MNKITTFLLCMVFTLCATVASAQGPKAVDLRSAADFAVLAGATVTNTGKTVVVGDLGVYPGSAVTGFEGVLPGGPGMVVGTIYAADPVAKAAQGDLLTAYDDAKGRTVGAILVAGNLGGRTLAPGLYKSSSSLEISSGDLYLTGNKNSVFIFQMESTLVTTVGRKIILVGGVNAANIFWQVGSSATLGTNSVFEGTIMADQSITITTGATLNGRALARIAAVTLDTNKITNPTESRGGRD
jgi:hypothetical protein